MAVDGEPTPDILTPANLTRPYLKDGEIIALPYTHIYTVLTKIGSKYGFAWEGCIYVYRGTKS